MSAEWEKGGGTERPGPDEALADPGNTADVASETTGVTPDTIGRTHVLRAKAEAAIERAANFARRQPRSLIASRALLSDGQTGSIPPL